MSQSNRASLRYVRNDTFGTRPTTPTMVEMLRVDATLDGVVETVESQVVRDDRMVNGLIQVGRNGGDVQITTELAYGQFDTWLEEVLCGTWSSAVAISAATISAAASDDSINDSGNGFVSGGIQAGMWILVNNLHATVDGLLLVNTVAAGKVTFSARIPLATGLYTESLAFTDQAAGATVTVKNAGMLRNGTTERSGTLEVAYDDVTLFQVWDDVRATKLELALSPKNIVKATFGFKARDFDAPTGSTISGSVTAANSNASYACPTDIDAVSEGTADDGEIIMGLNLSLENNVEMVDSIRSMTPEAMPYRTQRVTGSTDYYFSGDMTALVTKYRSQTESKRVFVISNGSSAKYMIVTVKALKYTRGTPQPGPLDSNVSVNMPWTAYAHSDGYQIQIDRIAT